MVGDRSIITKYTRTRNKLHIILDIQSIPLSWIRDVDFSTYSSCWCNIPPLTVTWSSFNSMTLVFWRACWRSSSFSSRLLRSRWRDKDMFVASSSLTFLNNTRHQMDNKLKWLRMMTSLKSSGWHASSRNSLRKSPPPHLLWSSERYVWSRSSVKASRIK